MPKSASNRHGLPRTVVSARQPTFGSACLDAGRHILHASTPKNTPKFYRNNAPTSNMDKVRYREVPMRERTGSRMRPSILRATRMRPPILRATKRVKTCVQIRQPPPVPIFQEQRLVAFSSRWAHSFEHSRTEQTQLQCLLSSVPTLWS